MFYVWAFLGGLFLTLVLVFPVSWFARAIGAIARPGGRSIHEQPTPLIGGLAIYLSCLSLGLFFFFTNPALASSAKSFWWKLIGVLCASTFLLLVGIIDDLKQLRARTKLLGQIAAATICVFFGFSIDFVEIPLMGSISMGALGPLVFIVWVLIITNAVNLIDGLDGLASTVCFFAATGTGLLALWSGNTYVAFFSFLLAGCLVGFLFHNFPPAKIFLGDTGSMLLGFLLAVTIIQGQIVHKKTTALAVLAPLLLLGFSLLDVLLSVVRRFLRGKPIFSSDLGDIHHRLMSRFRNPRRVLLIVGCFSLFTMVVSFVVTFSAMLPSWLVWSTFFFSIAVMYFFVRLIGYFRIERLRHVLEHREDVKFFTALLAYQRASLPRCQNKEAILSELEWVCRALKPDQVILLEQPDCEILYHFGADRVTPGPKSYSDELNHGEITVRWSCTTQSEDPMTCDVRLMWREYFLLILDCWAQLKFMEPIEEDASTFLLGVEEPTNPSTGVVSAPRKMINARSEIAYLLNSPSFRV